MMEKGTPDIIKNIRRDIPMPKCFGNDSFLWSANLPPTLQPVGMSGSGILQHPQVNTNQQHTRTKQ